MHTWKKDIVSWRCGNALYISVPFTWLLQDAEELARKHKSCRIIAGGPAVALMGAPWANETPASCEFDVLSMHNPCATYTTRGCPNKCGFCAVPRLEGEFKELPTWKHAPVICDNNLLAASAAHFAKVIESLRAFRSCDFNQGLDARLFTPSHASMIASLRAPIVRFSLDYAAEEQAVADAIKTCSSAGLPVSNVRVNVLIGFNDTPADALSRCQAVVKLGAMPCPMRFQPLDALQRNAYVAPGWTAAELRKMTRYFWKSRFLKNVPYEDFNADDGHSLFPMHPVAEALE